MVDQIFDRQYQAGRHELHAGIDALLQRLTSGLMNGFRVLTRIQFDAPWKTRKLGNSR